jgi:hypothetical protein
LFRHDDDVIPLIGYERRMTVTCLTIFVDLTRGGKRMTFFSKASLSLVVVVCVVCGCLLSLI